MLFMRYNIFRDKIINERWAGYQQQKIMPNVPGMQHLLWNRSLGRTMFCLSQVYSLWCRKCKGHKKEEIMDKSPTETLTPASAG